MFRILFFDLHGNLVGRYDYNYEANFADEPNHIKLLDNQSIVLKSLKRAIILKIK
jgi:hypothetical protein